MIATEPRSGATRRPRSLRRLLTTAAALTLLPLGLTACTSAATEFVYQPAQGVNDRDGDVDVLNALIVTGEDGEGRFIAGLANDNPDEADAITGVAGSGEDTEVNVQFAGGETEIPAAGFLQLAEDDAAMVSVSGETVQPGTFVRLTVTFSNAEPVELNVPVVTQGEDYVDVELSGAPSDSGDPSEAPSPSDSASQ